MALLGLATVIALLVSLFPQVAGVEMKSASAHNLQTRMVSMFMDPTTQAMLDARMAAPGWTPPDPLLQAGDELGLIIKVIPRDGTTTGVGGHVDFYVPNGVQVMDAAYLVPDGAGGFTRASMKGQSPIAVGDGPVGAKTTAGLVGWSVTLNSPNGISTQPVVPASGLHRGTIAGVYGDTGIFYSTDPDAAYGSWQKFTGDWNNANPAANGCGSLAYHPGANGKTIVNNSGDTDVPCNKWDAEQLMAYGAKGGTYGASAPIVDPGDGRGNAPWGFASGVAGPQSGYAWMFDWDEWNASAKNGVAMQAAMDTMGPWQRIKYPGSRISYDQPGLTSTVLGYASQDASNSGWDLAGAPLAATVSQTDNTSPKVIRWAVGQLTAYRPEYVWVKVKVNSAHDIVDKTGCPLFKGDTFGGDAGGTDNGKDHLWRYYEPTEITMNGCLAVSKPATVEFAKVGDNYQYKIKVYNLQGFTIGNVKVTDTLGSGMTFVSAVPAQASGPNPLVWNIGNLDPGEKFEATVTVKATGSGYLDNSLVVTADDFPAQGAGDTTIVGNYPYLVPTKTASVSSVAPGGTVEYTLLVKNVGGGATGSPVTLDEYLPVGFLYDPTFTPVVMVNGASVAGTTAPATATNTPSFSVPLAINGFNQLTLKFRATVPASVPAGNYCNTYRVVQGGVPITSGSQACVDVAGGAIGDTVFRDWDGDGIQDPGEEGIAGITVCVDSAPQKCATTDATGKYVIGGLGAATYTVTVQNPPANTTLTTPGVGTNVVLAQNEQKLTIDWGFQPTGAGSIGDLVFEDKGNDGAYNAGLGDVGIPGVTVNLYEDANGNGVIDPADALVKTTTTNASGNYSFSGLATGYNYLVDVVDAGITSYFSTTGWAATTVDPHLVTNLQGAYTNADFGYYKLVPGGIGDQLFVDSNGNGTYEPGTDQPLPNITVELIRDDNGNGVIDPGEPLIAVDSSDAAGIYGFANLPQGNYIVVVDSGDPDVPAGLYPVKGQIATNLSSGEVDNTLDFPFTQLVTKTVSPTTPAQPGDTLTYTLNVNYPGTTALENVVITDTLPAGVTYVPGSANAGGFLAVDGKTVTWNLGSGGPGHPGVTQPTGTALCYDTKTYVATRDTYIDLNSPTSNYGNGNEILTRPAAADRLKHSLVYFDLAANPVPAGAQILKADFSLTVTGNRGNHKDEVHRMITAWTEGTGAAGSGATWNDSDGTGGANGWNGAGGAFSSASYTAASPAAFLPTANGVKTVSIISIVNDWVNNAVTNQGLALISTGTDGGDAKYGSRTNAGREPKLVVGYYYQSNAACGATVDLPSVADTYIQKDSPNTTAGTATTMLTNPAVNDTGNNTNHSLVKFDLSAIPPGATITAATLKVMVTTDRDNDHEVAIHRMITPWTEAGASWSDSNGSTAGDWSGGTFGTGDYGALLGSFFAINKQQYTVANLQATVNDWINNGVANNGFVMRATNTDNGDAKHGTRENTTAANRPVLTVTWSATPSLNPQTTTTLVATPLYRNGTGQVAVAMTVSSGGTINGVTPPADLTTSAAGATVTKASGPAPAGPVTISNGNPATFLYVYNVTQGALPGIVSWTGAPSLPAATFATASSETVLVAPALTFQVTVDAGFTGGSIKNIAWFSSKTTGAQLAPDICYIIADGNPDTTTEDELVFMDPSTGDYSEPVGGATGTGTYNVEGMAWAPDGTKLYAVEQGNLVTINPNTGAFTLVGPVGAIAGAFGTIFTPDVDTLAFDPATGKLYAVARREDSPITAANTLVDVLFQIDPATGLRVANAFGAGQDYVQIQTQTLTPALYDVDGISFDPYSGILYAIANDSTGDIGLSDRLVKINKTTGAVTDVGRLTSSADGTTAITDMEGLSYLPALGVIGTTGDASTDTTQRNLIWVIQTDATGGLVAADRVTPNPASPYVDWEAVACQVGPTAEGEDIVGGTGSNATITPLKASIGDKVWADLDGQGDQDASEPGIAGVTVKLYDSAGTTLLATTVTDANGVYHFWDLSAGTYKVTYDLATAPAGYQPTTAATITATVSGTQQFTTADFGLEPAGTAKIGDTVWIDKNENGSVDAGESGLPGVTVRLYDDLNGNGILDAGDPLIQTTTTDANGIYGFSGLQDGKYLVQVDTSSPVTSPYDGTTTIAAAMDQVFGVNPKPVTLADGQNYTAADFGYNWGGSIGDYVWMDNNRNGLPDGGETPVTNAAVLLYFDANNNGILDPAAGDYQIGFAQTNASGFYLFDNLAPGHYLVDVYEDSITTDGNRDVVPTTPDVRYENLGPNQDILTADFGYYEGALVQGNVFWDDDRNGILDPVETGLSPVTVTLTGQDQFGNPVSLTTTTDANGHYSFVVPVGTYTVTYTPGDVTAIDPSLGETTTPTSYTFFAPGGEDWHPSFDFGVDNSGKIGDRVWNDPNGNGAQDPGEPGIAGVTVNLYYDSNNDGLYSAGDKWMGATATDANGGYLFTGLADGPYVVVVNPATLPAGYTQTGDPDPVVDNQSAATITTGSADLLEDFGYKAPANTYTITGTIYNDTSGNGVQDGGEPGLPGVKVCLYDSAGATQLACTTTVANGDYAFPGQPNGTYVVKVDPTTLPSPAYGQTGDPDASKDNQTTVTVNNAPVIDKDFGYKEQLGSISGTVCVGDGDGKCDVGETPLPTTVTLIYAGSDGILGTPDDVSTPQSTDPNGNYTFPNLAPGLYQVVETNPPSYNGLADADGGNPDNITVILPLGGTVIDRDFEDQKVSSGTIGDFVWWDINKDGKQDAGEPGIPGVTVELLLNGNPIQTTMTDANGLYQFTGLADGSYVVRIASNEFTAGNTLYNWTASPANAAGVPDTQDSDGDATTHEAPVTLVTATADTDFGFTIASSYKVTKTLVSNNPARPGEEVVFEIKIENTGSTWLAVVPLQDAYNNVYLTYGFGPSFASPDSNDHANDGVLDWTDVTAASPYGFGADIAPGQTKTVTVHFTAKTDTTPLGINGTANTATLGSTVADPDGPNGPLPALEPLPTVQPSSANVAITVPTGESFASFVAGQQAGGVKLEWRTVSEGKILGFNVQRAAGLGAAWETVNPDPILSENPGLEQGSGYSFFDEPAPGKYVYRLEVIRLDGSTEPYGSVLVTVRP